MTRIPFLMISRIDALIHYQSPVRRSLADQLGVHDLSPAGTSPFQGITPAPPPPVLLSRTACALARPPFVKIRHCHPGLQPATPVPPTTSGDPAGGMNHQQLCLSCHEATWPRADRRCLEPEHGRLDGAHPNFGADRSSAHPFSMKTPLVDSPELASQVFSCTATTRIRADGEGNVECVTFNDAHFRRRITRPACFSSSTTLANNAAWHARPESCRLWPSQQWGKPLSALGPSRQPQPPTTLTKPALRGRYNRSRKCLQPLPHVAQHRPLSRPRRGADEQACLAATTCGTASPPAGPTFSQNNIQVNTESWDKPRRKR